MEKAERKLKKDQEEFANKDHNEAIGRQITSLNQKAKVAKGISEASKEAANVTQVLGKIDNDKRVKRELSELDTATLKKVNERLEAEKKYKELNQSRIAKGYDIVHKTFNLAVPVAALIGSGLSAYAQYKELFKK